MGTNSIRSAILSGEGVRPASPIAKKQKRAPAAEPGSISGIAIKREESRHVDQRREDRRPAPVERATLILRGDKAEATVVNISPGGMMIQCEGLELLIGDSVDVTLADCNRTTCLVRWIRGKRIGLEFAEETTIVGSRTVQDFIIRSLRGQIEAPEDGEASPVHPKRTVRHRLSWTGSIYYDGESTPARLRNISAEGAMVECDWDFHLGTELMLDLEEAGTIIATVRWCRGGQLGLKFTTRFDMRALAKATPAPAAAPKEQPPAPSYDISIGDGAASKPVGKMSLTQVADLYGRAKMSR